MILFGSIIRASRRGIENPSDAQFAVGEDGDGDWRRGGAGAPKWGSRSKPGLSREVAFRCDEKEESKGDAWKGSVQLRRES